jgi:hypothetical protein
MCCIGGATRGEARRDVRLSVLSYAGNAIGGAVLESEGATNKPDARLPARGHLLGWRQPFRRSGRWSNRPAPRLAAARVTPQEQALRLACERVVVPEEQAAKRGGREPPAKLIQHGRVISSRTDVEAGGRTRECGRPGGGEPAHDERQAAHDERHRRRERQWNVPAGTGQHHNGDKHQDPQRSSHVSTVPRPAAEVCPQEHRNRLKRPRAASTRHVAHNWLAQR